MAKKQKKSPAHHANPEASPINGLIPPLATRWKPGQSGNPAGRPAAGATIKEHLNCFAEQDLNEPQIRKIAKDPKEPWTRRAAANRALRTMEAGDLTDFGEVLTGAKTLEDLRSSGINTEVVKKIKQKSRMVPKGEGEYEEVIDREIELHDRAGADFDRVCDRTVGKPAQAVDVTSGGKEIRVKVLSGVSMEEL